MRTGLRLAAVLLTVIGGLPALADTLPAVRFNTACAYCHEGECSGRLSFVLGADAAFAHIRRYAGELGDAEARQLAEALVHMKEHCAYLPLTALAAGITEPAALVPYRNPDSGDYFLPVGLLTPDEYSLQLQFAEPVAVGVEVINEHFDLVAVEVVDPPAAPAIRFPVDEAAVHFVRLRPGMPVPLVGFRLTAVPAAVR